MSQSRILNLTKASSSLTALRLILALSALFTMATESAEAQFTKGRREDLPDASGFYMSRRQYQIIDDGPVVRNSAGQVVPANQAGFGSNIGGSGAPLQRAGFQSYSSNLPQYNPSLLPKVNNGVPLQPAATPGGPNSLTAKALNMGKKKSTKSKGGGSSKSSGSKPAGKPSASNQVSAYNTYKGYSPAASANLPLEQSNVGIAEGGSAGSGMNSSTNVRGSVLHWSKRRNGQ
ncbi:MAG: hypothetical protein K2Y32_23545 [Candidatus Obscuribacterales bacterium]|nr:hypothetical protein [Candidatus Obscuribacterales bacterium]